MGKGLGQHPERLDMVDLAGVDMVLSLAQRPDRARSLKLITRTMLEAMLRSALRWTSLFSLK